MERLVDTYDSSGSGAPNAVILVERESVANYRIVELWIFWVPFVLARCHCSGGMIRDSRLRTFALPQQEYACGLPAHVFCFHRPVLTTWVRNINRPFTVISSSQIQSDVRYQIILDIFVVDTMSNGMTTNKILWWMNFQNWVCTIWTITIVVLRAAFVCARRVGDLAPLVGFIRPVHTGVTLVAAPP